MNSYLWFAQVTLFGLLVLGLTLVACNKWLPKRFCAKWPYWHLPPKQIGFDGCSMTGKCPRCGKEVLCDSQGNWF